MTGRERVTTNIKFAVGDEEYVAHFRAWRTPKYTYGADADGRRGETRQDIEDETLAYVEVRSVHRIWNISDKMDCVAWDAFRVAEAKGDIEWEGEGQPENWEE